MDPVLREGHPSFIQKSPLFTTGTRRHEAPWESSPGRRGALSRGLSVKLLCSEGPSQTLLRASLEASVPWHTLWEMPLVVCGRLLEMSPEPRSVPSEITGSSVM